MKTPRVITIIQARRASTRLRDKVLLPLPNGPVLLRMVSRVRLASRVGTVLVATTTETLDDTIDSLCRREHVLCYRGHPTDLLDRHYQIAKILGADWVVKIPSDCPLIDPAVIDRVLEFMSKRRDWFDYVSNLHPASYPDGNDVEVMTLKALETAWREASRPADREHTTPFLWDNPERFRIGNVLWESDRDLSMSHRWTLDYPEDYQAICAICEALDPVRPEFSIDDIVRLLDERPDIRRLNQQYLGVNWYRHHLGELRTISPEQTRHPVGPSLLPSNPE